MTKSPTVNSGILGTLKSSAEFQKITDPKNSVFDSTSEQVLKDLKDPLQNESLEVVGFRTPIDKVITTPPNSLLAEVLGGGKEPARVYTIPPVMIAGEIPKPSQSGTEASSAFPPTEYEAIEIDLPTPSKTEAKSREELLAVIEDHFPTPEAARDEKTEVAVAEEREPIVEEREAEIPSEAKVVAQQKSIQETPPQADLSELPYFEGEEDMAFTHQLRQINDGEPNPTHKLQREVDSLKEEVARLRAEIKKNGSI